MPAYSINNIGVVTTTGRLNGNYAGQSLWFQYSPDGKSGWINLWHLTTGPFTGSSYTSFLMQTRGAGNGYYRVVHFESPQMLGIVQPAHWLSRSRTQMSIGVTPTRPANGKSKLAVSGVVIQMTTKGWAHYAHAHVVLVYQPKEPLDGNWVQKGYTDSGGHFSFSTPAYGDGSWHAYLDADSAHYYSETKTVNVDVLH